jgi:hypothetical protein
VSTGFDVNGLLIQGGGDICGSLDVNGASFDIEAFLASCIVPGCTSMTACNYNVDATEDNGSCIEPAADCSICDGSVLVIVDTDLDGICDAEEVPGCTNPSACNFDVNATDDDASCFSVTAGSIAANGETTACVGDGNADELSFSYTSAGNDGANAAWVVTDLSANILDVLPVDGNSVIINFENAAPGNCLVWYLSYESLEGGVPANAGDLAGCYDLSNPVEVIRLEAGCDDPAAANYNPNAECPLDCVYDVIPGCTDPAASNYNPSATVDDGT